MHKKLLFCLYLHKIQTLKPASPLKLTLSFDLKPYSKNKLQCHVFQLVRNEKKFVATPLSCKIVRNGRIESERMALGGERKHMPLARK